MAKWQLLCELLLNEDMTAHDVLINIGVKPYRLKQMLRSKRLASRLALAEAIANKRAGHTVAVGIAPAAQKLAELTDSQRPETARRACLDLIETARKIYKG
ncbi:MAG: hypothetical protein SVV80_11290 [Planctomycetota bacterium]|nr:hypothetical protein [Planctomycetota bacterium]